MVGHVDDGVRRGIERAIAAIAAAVHLRARARAQKHRDHRLKKFLFHRFSFSCPYHVSILASGVKHLFRYCFHVPVAKLNDAISSQVACLLKEERAKRGLSLNVLAQKAGVSRQTVSYVEQEVQNPTLDTLLRISAVLEVDLEKIIAKARKAAVKREQ